MASRLPRRLFDLVEAMQGSDRHTTADLAAQLGVSERTIRRDLGRLQELDLPVESRPGRHGGVSLPSGALLPSLRFTDDELLAFVVGLQQAVASEDEQLQQAAARALQRLETVLSPITRDRVRALQRAWAPGARSRRETVPAPSEHVFALAEAIDRQRTIHISYRSPGQYPLSTQGDGEGDLPGPVITERRVDPYGLARFGPWYLVAYCHLRRDLRTFRVDRIRGVRTTDDGFARPADFDAYRHVAESIAMAPGYRPYLCRVLLETDIQTASRHAPMETVVLEPVADGVRMSARTDQDELYWFATQLLRLPCPVTIEGPAELVVAAERLTGRANRLMARTVAASAPGAPTSAPR